MNPWTKLLETSPFVLPSDQQAIAEFNAVAKPLQKIDITLRPEPYLGRREAPVVLLGLNPGWSPQDSAAHNDPTFARRNRENLLHQESEYPFYLLVRLSNIS